MTLFIYRTIASFKKGRRSFYIRYINWILFFWQETSGLHCGYGGRQRRQKLYFRTP